MFIADVIDPGNKLTAKNLPPVLLTPVIKPCLGFSSFHDTGD
jgi:hypothetical protein